MVGASHHFVTSYDGRPDKVAERQRQTEAELTRARQEVAALRHELDVARKTARVAASLLSHLDRKPPR